MDVLIDHQMFCIQRAGGVTRIFLELIRELSRFADCRVHWFRGIHKDAYSISDFRPRLASYRAPFRQPGFLGGWDLTPLNRRLFGRFARRRPQGYDIYHPTYYDADLVEIPRWRKLAITVYDMILEKFLANVDRFRRAIEGKRRLIERADLIFVNSRNTLADLIELIPVDPARILVTPLASRVGEHAPAALPSAVGREPFFLYVGTRSKYKNFEAVLRAFAASDWLRSGFRVVCFGGSSDFVEPELKFMEEHGLRGRFEYLAGDDGLLRALYENAVALAYPSRYEGFGLPPLEAMQCGCPVICCANSSLPEVTGDAAIFVDPDAPEELAHRMRELAEKPDLRRELARRGRLRAAEFTWERTARETLDGYRSVCGA